MMSMLYYALVASIVWSVFCRARKMDHTTCARLKLQHGAVMVLSLASLPIFGIHEYASELLAAALALYLWGDAQRWKRGPPTFSPTEIPVEVLSSVLGRGKE